MGKCARCEKRTRTLVFWAGRAVCPACYAHDVAIASKVKQYVTGPRRGECAPLGQATVIPASKRFDRNGRYTVAAIEDWLKSLPENERILARARLAGKRPIIDV